MRFFRLIAAFVLCGTLAACTPAGGQATPEPAVTAAPEAMALAGLAVPETASKVTFLSTDDTPFQEHYRISFELPAADAQAFCGTGDLGGAMPVRSLSESEQQYLGPFAQVEAGSSICASQYPANTAWQRTVLIDGKDPATVWVSLGRMGR